MAPSIARGLAVVGTSPQILISGFLAALVLWLGFVAYGTALGVGVNSSANIMAQLLALPPLHSLLIDLGVLLGSQGASPGVTLPFLIVLLTLRATFLGLWIGLVLRRLGHHTVTPDEGAGPPRGPIAEALRLTGRNFAALLGVEAGFLVLSLATALLAAGFAIGQFAGIAGLVGGLYFFVFTPMAVVAEGVSVREAARLSYRAARLPGPRHMAATFAYLAVALFISVFTPPSRVAAATPDLRTWLFVLFVSFLHLAGLAMFTDRWLLIREQVREAARQAPRTRRRGLLAPLR